MSRRLRAARREDDAISLHVRAYSMCLLAALATVAMADTVIEDVVVTGARSASLGEKTGTTHTLARERLRGTPHLGEDVFRAVARVPGIAADEYAAQFSIRGGEVDEVLVLLDGMELYEPFHLKDVNGGALSIVDIEPLESVRMLTGGIPARFGDRLSGVMELTSAPPTDERRASLGLSMTNARALAQGRFSDDLGGWLAVARRGYLDLVLDITDASPQVDLRPVYYDGFAKFSRKVGASHTLSAHALWAADTMTIVDDEDTVENSYANGYGWLTWHAELGDSATHRTLLSVGRVTRERVGIDLAWTQGRLNSEVFEDRTFDLIGLKQDWRAAPSEAHLLSVGFDVKRHWADYAYTSSTRRQPATVGEYATRESQLIVTGTQVGLYASDNVTLSRSTTADVGVRYDDASWSGDGLVAPRVAVVHMLGANTVVRAGWGRFSQFQRIADLRVEDGEEEFRPPERSEHWTLGVEHVVQSGLSLSVEGYWKRLTDIHPRYRNLDGDIDFFPEVARDRATVSPDGGTAKGVEVVLTRDVGDALSWWASYAVALTEEDVDGVTTPRDFDQRHAFALDVSYRPSDRWSLNVGWQVRSGRPYTPTVYNREMTPRGPGALRESYGAVNSARLPPYHRLDVRALRRFGGERSRLAVYAEVRNVYDRGNVRRYDTNAYVARGGEIVVQRTPITWLPILPSLGLRWDF